MLYGKKLRNIFIIACTIAILYPLVNFYVIFPSIGNISAKNAEDDAIRVARHLASMVMNDDGTLNDQSVYSKAIVHAENDLNLEKLKIFSPDGTIIYSSDSKDIGTINEKEYFHNTVAKGIVFTKVVKKDAKTLEGRVVRKDVVETYVPIMSSGNFSGAFEIYYDISSSKAAMNKIVMKSSLVTFSIMFGFFIILILVLLKADSVQSVTDSALYLEQPSPFNVLFMTAISIFAGEAIVMYLVSIFPSMSMLEEALLDASLLIMFVSPILYFFVLSPLMHQVRERRKAESELKSAHDKLEARVMERTVELAESNKQLSEEMKERIKAVKALEESEEKYRTLVNSTDDSIYLVDRNSCYLFMNKKHISRLRISENDYLGKCYSDLHSSEISSQFTEKVRKIFETGMSMQFEYKSPRDDRYFLQTMSPVKDHDGNIFAVSVISKNITDRKRMEEDLRNLSLTDQLTGLYNRRGFFALAEQQLKMSNRMKVGIYMLYADIDNLKEINDTYGH
ncbi:MAG: diguanylate cyclase, partial [Nitrospirota bacterium]